MEPGNLIKSERVKRDWSQADLAQRVGISQPAIKKIEAGTTVKSKHFPKIAELLDIPLSRLDPSLTHGGKTSVNQTENVNSFADATPLQTVPPEQLMGEIDLPVYSIVQGGRVGALVLENEPYTYTKRPRRLVGVAKGYGVLVNGNSCAREFNHNDIAHVDPHLHPKKDFPCIFQRIKDGEVEAMIKYLDRSPDASETLYYVFQTNPFKKFTIKKADWQKVHVVVGKESGI